jgi:hypothetical protein
MQTEIEFIRITSERFKEAFDRIVKAIVQLDARQIWIRPSPESNSVGIIVQYLIGNLHQWVCAGVGGAEFQTYSLFMVVVFSGWDVQDISELVPSQTVSRSTTIRHQT